MSTHNHSINYIEFYVTDIARAQKFYSQAFGWEFTKYSPGYAGIKNQDGGEAGGLCVVDEVIKGGPLVVLFSNELDESLKAVKGANGEIVKEIFEFPGGRRFEFADPDGNQLAVWTHT